MNFFLPVVALISAVRWSSRHAFRWRYVLMNFRNYPFELNRRSQVELELWDCFHKDYQPTPGKCREWAILLGIPDGWK